MPAGQEAVACLRPSVKLIVASRRHTARPAHLRASVALTFDPPPHVSLSPSQFRVKLEGMRDISDMSVSDRALCVTFGVNNFIELLVRNREAKDFHELNKPHKQVSCHQTTLFENHDPNVSNMDQNFRGKWAGIIHPTSQPESRTHDHQRFTAAGLQQVHLRSTGRPQPRSCPTNQLNRLRPFSGCKL